MKGYITILTIVLSCSYLHAKNLPVSRTDSRCPAVNPVDHDVLLPAEDCQHFYKCNHGVPVLIPCPAKLEWSQKLQRCDYPEVADCHNGEQPVDPEKPTTPKHTEPLPTECPAENPIDHDVLLPSKDCTKFYKCNYGVPVLQDCPHGLEWSQALQRCEYPEIAKCSGSENPDVSVIPEQPSSTSAPKEPLPTSCPAENPVDHDVLLPSKDCTKFYKCNHGVPVLLDCPKNLEWSQQLQRCDYPEVAKCTGGNTNPEKPTEKPTTSKPVEPLPTSCPSENPIDHDVLLPSSDCTKFYKCNYGTPVLQDCPQGLEWSQNLQRCEYPEIAQCTGTVSTPGDNHVQVPELECPKENGQYEVILGIPGDCTHFIKCDFGEKKIEMCPPGTTWNHQMTRCDFPEISQCVPGVIPPEYKVLSSVQTYEELPKGCPAENPEDHDVLLPSEDCTKFYKCNNGVPVLLDCPAGLEWSQKLQRCDYPEVAQCTNGPVTDDPEHPTEDPIPEPTSEPLPTECPAENPEDHDVLLPSKDCTKFYKCDAGVPILQSCPAGLEWSQKLQRCEYPEIAQCTGGQDPDPEQPTTVPKPEPTREPLPTECPAENPEDHDVLLPSEDCTKFYKCNNGVPVLLDCPAGLEWSQKLQRCDYPEVAQCTNGPVTDDPELPTEVPIPEPTSEPLPTECPAENPEDHDVLLPSKDCTKFYKCDAGVPILQDCPAGLEWSQKLQRCEYPEIAQCTGGQDPDPEQPTTVPKPEPTPEPLPTECPAENPEDHDVLLPSKDCTKFYKCDAGVPVLLDCPPGLEWSQPLQRCDYPEVAKCSAKMF